MPNERDELVRRLQAQADAMRDEPVELILGREPGPYRVPQSTRAALMIGQDRQSVELILDTESGQRILVPLNRSQVMTLYRLIKSSLDEKDR